MCCASLRTKSRYQICIFLILSLDLLPPGGPDAPLIVHVKGGTVSRLIFKRENSESGSRGDLYHNIMWKGGNTKSNKSFRNDDPLT